MSLSARPVEQYYVFLASPGDVGGERQHVRRFFDDYNRSTAHLWGVRFEVVDWENYATIGVGRPQELITRQTLEKFRPSLALVIGIMGQRFGSPTGRADSGTEEEFNWAMESHEATGFPEIKWFFRKAEALSMPTDPDKAAEALDQWRKVLAFRARLHSVERPVFYAEYPDADFGGVFDRDLTRWLADPHRPWIRMSTANPAGAAGAALDAEIPRAFDSESYRTALLKRFDTLDFDMLDTTGAHYNAVRLWNVFVPQSVRECHDYYPQLLEIPKEHQRRLRDKGDLDDRDLARDDQAAADVRRREYFNQPLVSVLDAIGNPGNPAAKRVVILGDPGSGKSSLMRYLALQWAQIEDVNLRLSQPVPLVIELGRYGRWHQALEQRGEGRKHFARFLDESPNWYRWNAATVSTLMKQQNRVVLLLDGLDEIFDPETRDGVLNEIQHCAQEYPHVRMVVTSRVVGYKPQRLRDTDFRHFMLQDLSHGTGTSPGQIDEFLTRWHSVTFTDPAVADIKRERLRRAIRDSKSIGELAGNPLLLTMMAILNRNQELPRERADLYEQASRVLLHQWDTERALAEFPGVRTDVGLREKTDMLRRIAHHMQAQPIGLAGNIIDGVTLTRLIENYLYTELHFQQARAAARAVVEHLRQRNFVLCFLGGDSYAFVHRTFLEYFCAADIVHRFNVEKSLDANGLIALFEERCRDDRWREVLRLICGQIDERFVGQILERLFARIDLHWWDGERPIPEIPLAIWCLSEVRNPGRLEQAGAQLLSIAATCFLQGYELPDAFVQDLKAAVRDLGPRWPGLSALDVADVLPGSVAYSRYSEWPEYVHAVIGRREWIEQFSESDNAQLRYGALDLLAERWPDAALNLRLRRCAIEDSSWFVRRIALNILVRKWPDQVTRDIVEDRIAHEPDPAQRLEVLGVLAKTWRDEATHARLIAIATNDQEQRPEARADALRLLALLWPAEATRALLYERVVHDENDRTREAVLQAYSRIWSDEATRRLLCARAVEDPAGLVRGSALRMLAQRWRDAQTHRLLIAAIQDRDVNVRRDAFQNLAVFYIDDDTRRLVEHCIVTDADPIIRANMIDALARGWPDARTVGMLRDLAHHAPDAKGRRTALQCLADAARDETTRRLLAEFAVQDADETVRREALSLVCQRWRDERRRALLERRAVEDPAASVRSAALDDLTRMWPDDATRALLVERSPAESSDVRVDLLRLLVKNWPDAATRSMLTERAAKDPSAALVLARQHSLFGRVIFTEDQDGHWPFLDAHAPVTRERIEGAARQAGIKADAIDATVRSLSEYLGWDITKGRARRARADRSHTQRL
jgi:hypothetical protein